MPVKSLNSPVIKWPDASSVKGAVDRWVAELTQKREDILAIAYIGSYARGDWGVGSDLDLIVLVGQSELPIWQRALELDLRGFPVPTDVQVYTAEEWQTLTDRGGRFYQTVMREAVWVYRHPSGSFPG